MFTLPTAETLRQYTGPTGTETGMPPLIRRRMGMEVGLLKDAEPLCTIQIDEMHLTKGVFYDKVQDKTIGLAENVESLTTPDGKPVLANKLLCFYLTGL